MQPKNLVLSLIVFLFIMLALIFCAAVYYASNVLEIPSSWKNLLNEVPSTGKTAINIASSFPVELLIPILALIPFLYMLEKALRKT